MSLEKIDDSILEEAHATEYGDRGVSDEQREHVLLLREAPRYRRLIQLLSPLPGDSRENLEEKQVLLAELRRVMSEGGLFRVELRANAQLMLNGIPAELPRRIELQEALWDADEEEIPEITTRIKELIRLRRGSVVSAEYLKSHPEDAERVHQMIDRVREYSTEVTNMIGEGNNAWVYEDPKYRDICAKLIKNSSFGTGDGSNSPSQEFSYLDELANFEVDGVRSPFPYTLISDPGLHTILMERLHAVSVGDLVKNITSLPRAEEFDVDAFAASLFRYFKELHAKKIVHFDPHEGNVMIDFDTHKPRVIDFGKSRFVEGFGDEEDKIEQYKKSDFGQLAKVIELLRDWKAKVLTNQ